MRAILTRTSFENYFWGETVKQDKNVHNLDSKDNSEKKMWRNFVRNPAVSVSFKKYQANTFVN